MANSGRAEPGLSVNGNARPPEASLDGPCRIGSVLLGVTFGTQAMLVAMLLVSRTLTPTEFERLTEQGRLWFHPEYDMVFYLSGCIASLLFAAALTGAAAWKLRRVCCDPEQAAAFRRYAAWLQYALAATATLAFFWALRWFARGSETRMVIRAVVLAAPSALAVLTAMVGLAFAPARLLRTVRTRSPERERAGAGEADPLARPARPGRVLPMVASLLAVVSLVAVPDCRRLAGASFLLEGVPFHHTDYFAMGPAVAYAHGAALGTDVYSQYGVGWPTLFGLFAPWYGLSYGRMLSVFLCCGTAYFALLFLALRSFLNSVTWAAAGTILSIFLQVHHGVHPGMTVWLTPASSVLRSPMDVAFFFALLLHLRTGRPRWALVAGGLTGLALCFETDTGLYLVMTLAFYFLAQLARRPDEHATQASLRLFGLALASFAVAAAALLPGLAVASRGTLLQSRFWWGWLEALRLYGGGMSAMPITTAAGVWQPLFFLAQAATYIVFIALVLVSLPGRRASRGLVLAGCVAVYGSCLLLQYVNRSHEYNLFHGCIPFCVLCVATIARLPRRFPGGSLRWVRRWSPHLALGFTLAALAVNPSFRAYPHIWNRIARHGSARDLSLMSGVKGLPADQRGSVVEFRAVVSRVAALRRRGMTVAVLDASDTMFYLASGTAPPDRYHSLLTQIIRKEELAQSKQRLAAKGIDVWVMRDTDRAQSHWGDVYLSLYEMVRQNYRREDVIGGYSVWRALHPSAPSRLAQRASKTSESR